MEALTALSHHPFVLYLQKNPLPLWISLGVFLLLLLSGLIWKMSRRQDHSGIQVPAPESALSTDSMQKAQEQSLAEAEASDGLQPVSQDTWLTRLREGMSRSRASLQSGIGKALGHKTLDEETLENLHEVLFRADLGINTTDKLIAHIGDHLRNKQASWDDLRQLLIGKSLEIFHKTERDPVCPSEGPRVILVVGVNGVGKTTTIGKLAAHFLAEEKKVLLCAADTYRAAAIEQLKIWGERLKIKVVAHKQGADPAATSYDGVQAAIARKADVLLVDTAGRLHSKQDLMAELAKIRKVIEKALPGAPHETWLVLDATTGQNAFAQTKAFNEMVSLSGLVVTKLDGTAKGGVIIGVCDEFSIPVRYIGVGESASDLREFNADDYLQTLFGTA